MTDAPPEVTAKLVKILGSEEAATAWWATPDNSWLGGLSPAELHGSVRLHDTQLVIDVVEMALLGVISL